MYFFSKDGFFRHDASKPLPGYALRRGTWHLMDSNEQWQGFPVSLTNTRGVIVQASSPEEENYMEWVKQRRAREIWMDPVGWNEMYVIWYVHLGFTKSLLAVRLLLNVVRNLLLKAQPILTT